jgi:hypothetical protein
MAGMALAGVFVLIYIATGFPMIYDRNHVIVITPNTTGIAKINLLNMKSLSFIRMPP